jgi:transcriptional regulator with XRE-family HTH domain
MSAMGATIKRMRKRRGLTQGQLAIYAGINRSYISQIENGHVDSIGSAILVRIAHHLDVSTDYLLGLTADPRTPRDWVGRELSRWEQGLLDKFAPLGDEHKAIVMALLDSLLEIASRRSRRDRTHDNPHGGDCSVGD